MKVWICSDGEYSSYGVTAVYSKEEDAKAISRAYGWNDPEAFDLDPAEIPDDARQGRIYFRVILPGISSAKPWAIATRPHRNDRDTLFGDGRFSAHCWAMDADAAVKIAAERLAKVLLTAGHSP